MVPIRQKTVDNAIQVEIFDTTGWKRFLGTASSGCLQQYAVVKDTNSRKKDLYKQGDWIDNEFKIIMISNDRLIFQDSYNGLVTLRPKIPDKGLEFIETVELDTFEYWYRLPMEDREITDKRFELTCIRNNIAVFEQDHKELLTTAKRLFSSSAFAPVANNTFKPGIDEVFFNQLKTKKMGPDLWLVDGKSVSESILDNTSETLAETAKKVKVLSFGQDGIKLAFKSRSGEATFDKNGFLVDSLSSSVKDKAGLLDGDIIKSINGK